LQAAAAPPRTDYYFFLSKKDGRAVFDPNSAQFQSDEQKYLNN
jgi:cell division protein YceG involved in septum cleavage